jgi:hypothetical protein
MDVETSIKIVQLPNRCNQWPFGDRSLLRMFNKNCLQFKLKPRLIPISSLDRESCASRYNSSLHRKSCALRDILRAGVSSQKVMSLTAKRSAYWGRFWGQVLGSRFPDLAMNQVGAQATGSPMAVRQLVGSEGRFISSTQPVCVCAVMFPALFIRERSREVEGFEGSMSKDARSKEVICAAECLTLLPADVYPV